VLETRLGQVPWLAGDYPIAALSDRDRGLLKLSVIHELSMDELCDLYKVHRTTLWHWIVQLKQQIAAGCRASPPPSNPLAFQG
jgi:hypothetical protein